MEVTCFVWPPQGAAGAGWGWAARDGAGAPRALDADLMDAVVDAIERDGLLLHEAR